MPAAAKKENGLLAKLLVAQTKASGVEKKGENKAQNYSYARAEDVIAEAQQALHEAELVGYMRPGSVESQEISSNSGTGGLFVTLTGELVIADPETGEQLAIPARGTGVDYPGDKAYYKALTGASKYAYASALGIPFGDDPENETKSTERAASGSGKAASPAQKGAITKALRRHQIPDDGIRQIVEAYGADRSAGASQLLDAIYGGRDVQRSDEEIESAVHELASTHITPTSDVPADTEGLDDVARQDAAELPDDAEREAIERVQDGEQDELSLEERAEPA